MESIGFSKHPDLPISEAMTSDRNTNSPKELSALFEVFINASNRNKEAKHFGSQDEVDASSLTRRVTSEIPTDERILSTIVDVKLNPGRNPQGIEIESEANGTHEEDGIFLVPDPQDRGQRSRTDLLCASKATITLSTAASYGKGRSRFITLKKKENEKEVEDTERQLKVDEKFMDLKHLLGLGSRPGYEKVMVNYSISWHFIQVYGAGGEKRYDLLDKNDIARLLRSRDLNHGLDDIERVYHSLLGMNRDLKKLIENEVGKEHPSCIHDYLGNQNGLRPFIPYSSQFNRILNQDKEKGRYLTTLEDLKLVDTVPGSNIFSPAKHQLTKEGAEAYSDMAKAKFLQKKMVEHLVKEQRKEQKELQSLLRESEASTKDKVAKKEKEIAELQKAGQEIASVNLTVINLTLMELNRKFTIQESGSSIEATGKEFLADISVAPKRYAHRLNTIGERVARDIRKIVQKENRTGWIKKEDYRLTKEDEKLAIEVAATIYMIGEKAVEYPSRLNHLDFIQSHGIREISQMPLAEDLLIHCALHSKESNLRHFEERGGSVKAALHSALADLEREQSSGGPRTFSEGQLLS